MTIRPITLSQFVAEDILCSRSCCRLALSAFSLCQTSGIATLSFLGATIRVAPALRYLSQVDFAWGLPKILENSSRFVATFGTRAMTQHGAKLIGGGVGFVVGIMEICGFPLASVSLSCLKRTKLFLDIYALLYKLVTVLSGLHRRGVATFSAREIKDLAVLAGCISALCVCAIGGLLPLILQAYAVNKWRVHMFKCITHSCFIMGDLCAKMVEAAAP